MIDQDVLAEVKNPAVKTIEKRIDGFCYKTKNGMIVIQSAEREADGQYWIHTSFSRASRMPEYKDMQMIKNVFIGDQHQAIMILPEKTKHVNIHPFCLHFFTPVNKSPLPDFTRGSGSI